MNAARPSRREMPVLILGATGYVGGRLAPRLLAAGWRVRAMGRSLEKLSCRPWASHPNCELVQGDVMDVVSLARALRGCWAAFYLVHSMNRATRDFAAADRKASRHMALAAEAAGLERIVYLGGLVPDDPNISHHLRSRAEVGRILQSGAVPCTWLRAAMILGAGSASFELLRYLAERLPVMITPRWVRSLCQPIAIGDVLGYLEGCLDQDQVSGQTLDIGGPDIHTYEELFQIFAQEAGLRPRIIIPVPVLSPRLSSYWIRLVTPVPASLGRPLAEGLRNTVVCKDNRIRDLIPQELTPDRTAIRLALQRMAQERVETCWMDAGRLNPPEWVSCGDAPFAGGTIFRDGYQIELPLPRERVWESLAGVGGSRGWFYGSWLWRLRGLMDEAVGGPGLRRGRRSQGELRVGDALDFWRVLELEPPQRLLLLAEMKLPGQATLELRLVPSGADACQAQLIVSFLPQGLGGLAYWYSVWPLHQKVFGGLLGGLARQAGVAEPGPVSRFDPVQAQACATPPTAH
ncbi:MAG: SDR family oxidoreductase [Desulfarculaceae bacterium]|nr:SDR family oxidoreductase [Desulfarculaceae bacterium]MCF8070800.1 SDR family oxidoreductase [Desulfarculaceae bacterium]MCF8102237.1 SDR family oxidoreductase [Desulfarculaceae bacterium]MCF8117701.1 SDR family oxidoreductase [Desulfarculaceae bacterium]